jgi:hypothetical protein
MSRPLAGSHEDAWRSRPLPSRPQSSHRWHAPCAHHLSMNKVRSQKDGVGAPTLPRVKDLGARRLLSPDEAARYLGLGSRWAIRRLVVSGDLPL